MPRSFTPSVASNSADSPIGHSNAAGADNVALLARVAALDAAAFGELYENLATPMLSLVVRIVGSRADAEDVLQIGFHQVWLCAPDYRADLGSPTAWIGTIMRRKAIDGLRARSRHFQRLSDSFHLRCEDRETEAGDARLVVSEKKAAVRSALFRLNLEERCAIQMAYFDGLTNTEVAKISGAPVGTVKARIRRGMMKLRRTLASASVAA